MKHLISLITRRAALALLLSAMTLSMLPAAAAAAEGTAWNSEYDVNEAVSYALKYAIDPNGEYIYYGEYDCCSFVSQCLKAGGLKDVYTGSCWYYLGGNCSPSWWNCSQLMTFLQEQGINIVQDPKYNEIRAGDLVFYDLKWADEGPNGEMDHVTICTGLGDWGIPAVCGHASNRKNINYNYAVAGSTYYVAQVAPRNAAPAKQTPAAAAGAAGA